MIIAYKVSHKNHPKPIELCGEFRDLHHFNMFQVVESFRGWFIVGVYKILKE